MAHTSNTSRYFTCGSCIPASRLRCVAPVLRRALARDELDEAGCRSLRRALALTSVENVELLNNRCVAPWRAVLRCGEAAAARPREAPPRRRSTRRRRRWRGCARASGGGRRPGQSAQAASGRVKPGHGRHGAASDGPEPASAPPPRLCGPAPVASERWCRSRARPRARPQGVSWSKRGLPGLPVCRPSACAAASGAR